MSEKKTYVWMLNGYDRDGNFEEPELYSTYQKARKALTEFINECRSYGWNVEVKKNCASYEEGRDCGAVYISKVEVK